MTVRRHSVGASAAGASASVSPSSNETSLSIPPSVRGSLNTAEAAHRPVTHLVDSPVGFLVAAPAEDANVRWVVVLRVAVLMMMRASSVGASAQAGPAPGRQHLALGGASGRLDP
jgi:hypothetical protein